MSLTHAQTGHTIHIEWFDTEIDSIVEIDIQGNRKHLDHFWIKNETLLSEHFERKTGILNQELMHALTSENLQTASYLEVFQDTQAPRFQDSNLPSTLKDQPINIILIGCDFHADLEFLRASSSMHFTDFHREDSISLEVSIPDIVHIDALRQYIRDNSPKANIRIYTKNEKSVQDFLDYHQLSHYSIISLTRNGLESCEIPERGIGE